MKVAILSPQPRTSGVVTYSHELARGFRALGHDCDVVTFTLSGKPSVAFKVEEVDTKRSGWGWSTLGYDRCERWDRAGEVLGEYELIVMEEPRCAPMDKRALRKAGDGDIKYGRLLLERGDFPYEFLPPYIEALSGLGDAKIAVTLHDPGYGFRLAPFLEEFMSNVAPDAIITHRDGSRDSAAWGTPASIPEIRIEHLPYTLKEDSERTAWQRVIGTTGRFINNKGQPTLALAMARASLPKDWAVEIAGASPLGAGPNHTFLTYEGLTKHYGFAGTRDGTDVTRGWPWEAYRDADNDYIRYVGPYQDPVHACSGFGVHVCMTDPGFSGVGSLEYVQLEAIDAGSMIVCHTSRIPKSGAPVLFEVEVPPDKWKLANAELTPVDEKRAVTADALGEAVSLAARTIEEGDPTEIAWHNREIVREWHDPARYAARVLEAL